MTNEDDNADIDESIGGKESIDKEENIDDYDETQCLNIRNNFTLKEMQDIVEWIDEHM